MTHKKISLALSRLALNTPFYAALALSTPIVEADSIPTFATDGSKIFYSPDFADSLSVEEIEFVLVHELEHIVRLHNFRMQGRDHQRWNIACDHIINLDLLNMRDLKPPMRDGKFIGYADAQYAGMSSEQVYDLLKDNPPPTSDDTASGHDDLLPPSIEHGQTIQDVESAVKGRIQNAANIIQAKHGRGAIPSHLRHTIETMSQPKVDWRYVLRDFMLAAAADSESWARVNRRVRHRGLKMPANYAERMGSVGVIVDTSGSVHYYIEQFMGELSGVVTEVNPEKVVVVFVDCEVQAVIETEPESFEADMGDYLHSPPSGGGTDLRPAFEELGKHACDVAIVLTDLDTPWPEKFDLDANTLIISTTSEYNEPPFGRVIVMEE